MSASPLLLMDTRMDRRDIWALLHRLPPRRRVAFVAAMCERAAPLTGNRPVPRYDREVLDRAYRDDSADRYVTNQCYGDVVALAGQWRLDLSAAACELERWVRGRPAPAPPAPPGRPA